MNVLLIDSSSSKIEFAYNKEGNFIILSALGEGQNADLLISELRNSFKSKGIRFADIDYIVLSNGPGSYTGLRIGSVIAKGICFTTEAKLVELCTLDIIANKAKHLVTDETITPLIYSNSKIGDFYFADFKKTAGELKRISGYGIINRENLNKSHIFPSNDKLDFSEEIKYINTSDEFNAYSMYELFIQNKHNTVDYSKSEPFYMKNIFGN